ncbi:hypothetical protein SAMN05660766_3605 [Curtobacterium sp. 314Chir4.1]|uniref:hypothetical protein n=1 Tax=Curtobacterium sp. 314Chir4.1 TaxID=1279028 RepID=UPI000BD47A86|nr:hypothetical protein [Curtobacterium sp. 314Chir4.1]SOC89871.1 hypothetical protein SAMN05660766_3605 [Curtobacterium sp. 314Chir4.1]
MNTEPPEGDDLHRMLVSMKQNVLERATPRPKRRRVRPGIAIGVVGLLAIGTATGAVALSLSQQEQPTAAPTQTQQPEPAPSATTPTSAPITPTATPTRSAVATIPTTCRGTVPSDDYDRFFGSTPLTEIDQTQESTGTDSPDILWTGGSAAITCVWADPSADVTGLTMDIGTTGPEADERLAESSWDCQERDGGRMCQLTVPAEPYPVDQTTTVFIRGDTFVVIRQANFPTNGLLDAVVGEIWGD